MALDFMRRAGVPKNWWVSGFVLLILILGAARIRAIWGTLPYSQHVDEVHLTSTALQIVKTHDLNPHFFKYPSLPIYLTALCMKVAAVLSHTNPASWIVPPKGGPYEPSGGYAAARILFGLLSIATLAQVGLLSNRIFVSRAALFIAPLALAASRVYQASGATYVNVDVATAFFLTTSLVVSFAAWGRDSVFLSALLPGAMAGMAAACKYTGAVVLLSGALAIALGQTERRPLKILLLGVTAGLAFVLFVPYSVFDRAHFVSDVKWEMHHYKTGHIHYDGPTGLPQLAYYGRELLNDYGGPALALAAVGLVFGLARRTRMSFALIALPVAILAHMSTNRVHFVRTVLPVFVVVPVFMAGGVVAVREGVRALLTRVSLARAASLLRNPIVPNGAAAAAFLFALSKMSAWVLLDRNIPRDTRNVAKDWLLAHANGRPVFVAKELSMQKSTNGSVAWLETSALLSNLPALVASHGGHGYVLFPRWKPLPRAWSASQLRWAPRTPPDPFEPALSKVGAAPVLSLPGAFISISPGPVPVPNPPSPALVIAKIP